MARGRFYIVKVIGRGKTLPMANRYRVIEKVMTVDGLRDRITNNSFSTYRLAQMFIKENSQ